MPTRNPTQPSTIVSQRNQTATTSVRRNLFNSTARRPIAGPSTSQSSNTTSTAQLPPSNSQPSSHDSASSHASDETLRLDTFPNVDPSASREMRDASIVVRDETGHFKHGEPPLAAELMEDAEIRGRAEDVAFEKGLAASVEEFNRGRGRGTGTGAGKIDVADLLNDVKQSLRMKVAALSEDNWMFEAEEQVTLR